MISGQTCSSPAFCSLLPSGGRESARLTNHLRLQMVRPRLRPGTGLDALAFFDVGLSWEGGVGEKISVGSFPERQ